MNIAGDYENGAWNCALNEICSVKKDYLYIINSPFWRIMYRSPEEIWADV